MPTRVQQATNNQARGTAPATQPTGGVIVQAAQQRRGAAPQTGVGDYLLGNPAQNINGVYDDVTVFFKKEMPNDPYAGELSKLKASSGEAKVGKSGNIDYGSSGAHQLYASGIKTILNQMEQSNIPLDIESATAAVKSMINSPNAPQIFRDLRSSGTSLAGMVPASASTIADVYVRGMKNKANAQRTAPGSTNAQQPTQQTIQAAQTQAQQPANRNVQVRVTPRP